MRRIILIIGVLVGVICFLVNSTDADRNTLRKNNAHGNNTTKGLHQ